MSDINVKETTSTKEYTVPEESLIPNSGDDEHTWYNKTAGILDKFRLIPRLIMLAYILCFYESVTWFMQLAEPTNPQAAFISTIVGAGAAFFGLYVGKPGSNLPKPKK